MRRSCRLLRHGLLPGGATADGREVGMMPIGMPAMIARRCGGHATLLGGDTVASWGAACVMSVYVMPSVSCAGVPAGLGGL